MDLERDRRRLSPRRTIPAGPGLIDLLGALAYGELSAFERMASDSRMAPNLSDRTALSAFAAGEFAHFQQLCHYLSEPRGRPRGGDGAVRRPRSTRSTT